MGLKSVETLSMSYVWIITVSPYLSFSSSSYRYDAIFSLMPPIIIIERFVSSPFKFGCFAVANVINEMVDPPSQNMFKFIDEFVTDFTFISYRQVSEE